MTIRDEKTGKFVAQSEQEKLEQQIKEAQARLEEIRLAKEQEVKAELEAKHQAAVAERKADVVKIQDAASTYLKKVKANNDLRESMREEEQKLYDAYQKELNDFAAKHKGYHLTYSVNGDNVEFKVEEAHADAFDRIRKEQEKFWNVWNNFFKF